MNIDISNLSILSEEDLRAKFQPVWNAYMDERKRIMRQMYYLGQPVMIPNDHDWSVLLDLRKVIDAIDLELLRRWRIG